MKPRPPEPRIETRRASDFRRELMARARAWIPTWGAQDEPGDFGAALLDIAARFSGDVAERLNRAGDKMARGLLDWLAVRGLAARPARMPVALKLADTAQTPVLAPAPVRLQVDVAGASVVFETEEDVQLVPGKLDRLVAIDPAADAYYLPPPGLTSLDPLVPRPIQWRTKSFAAAGAKTLQLDPPLGLAAGMQIDIASVQYLVTAVSGDLVTIDPPLQVPDGLEQDATVDVVSAFAPFELGRRNEQRHSLYLGHDDLLNLEAASTLAVRNAQTLLDLDWQYWGKLGDGDVADWQPLKPLEAKEDGLHLSKPKGAIDPTVVGTVQSRWIRATTRHLDGAQPLLSVDDLAIAINPDSGELKCPVDNPTTTGDAPELEAFANTTPLVLNTLFHPLGREPRQFDAFYLGSAEIFSKPKASVSLCFEMADPTMLSFAVVRSGWLQNRLLAGVGRDRALHLFLDDPATGNVLPYPNRPLLQPPLPALGAATSTTTIALDKPKGWRLPAWSNDAFEFFIAVAAGTGVWIWREFLLGPTQSGWRLLGASLPAPMTQGATIDGLVYLDNAAETMFALLDKKLYQCGINATAWTSVPTLAGATRVDFVSIAPIVDHASQRTIGLIGVAVDNTVYEITTAGACTQLAATVVDPEIVPAARQVTVGGVPTLYVIAADDKTSFRAITPVSGSVGLIDANAEILGGSLELGVSDAGKVFAIASARIDGATHLAAWGSLDAPVDAELFLSTVSPAIGSFGGAPSVLDRFIVAPGSQGDALVADWTPSALISGTGTFGDGIVVPTSFPLAPNDIVAADAATTMTVGYPTATLGAEAFHTVTAGFANGVGSKPILAFRVTNPTSAIAGKFLTSNGGELELAVNDHHLPTSGGIILMTSGTGTAQVMYAVSAVDPATGRAKLVTPPGIPDQTPVTYWRGEVTGARLAQTLTLTAANNQWNAAILAREPLTFHPTPGTTLRRFGKAFRVGIDNHPELIVFDGAPLAPPGNPLFIVNAAVGEWRRSLGDASANPELVWEYWNGSTWWTLGVTRDATLNLKSTGLVQFAVPDNLAPTEVAGRQNHWIRARLVGGDYGREQVKVKVKDLGGGVTEQTVERTSSEVRAPAVLALRVQYASEPTRPKFVLTEDSGSIRDQSDANATAGALLEAFVPLSLMLRRLERGVTPATARTDNCECDPCRAAAKAEAAAAAQTADAGPGRALFLGFDARLFGTPVNVMLVVDREQPHEGFAPLAVDVVSGDRFGPLIVLDTTRALGESGLLSLSFPVAPKPATLFGQTRTWLRLRPSRDDPTLQWRPQVRGAYLNTVWAIAQESLTREPLGTSDGRPMLTVRVARAPLVHDSLELRVREPLGEEEVAALQRDDPERVLTEVVDLPGIWVRWREVPDTADYGPDDRVYALDETIGDIQFGDGRHGMIPPMAGRDGIVAFRYARTEPPQPGQVDAPANRVEARTALNLVTPVESVEAAFAAGQAAGGAPPEVDTRVLRFGYARLRHRGRAVTREDFEDLALQSSVEMAQARCFVRNGRVRLVVVMRDGNGPSRAQSRELRRVLLEAAPPALAANGALVIEGPRKRALRVTLRLSVADLDDAGRVANAARVALAALFDPALGGADGRGWPLGALPRDDDVAYALADVADLESIDDIRLAFVDTQGVAQAWPATLPADSLAILGKDAVRVDFTPIEARDEAGA